MWETAGTRAIKKSLTTAVIIIPTNATAIRVRGSTLCVTYYYRPLSAFHSYTSLFGLFFFHQFTRILPNVFARKRRAYNYL